MTTTKRQMMKNEVTTDDTGTDKMNQMIDHRLRRKGTFRAAYLAVLMLFVFAVGMAPQEAQAWPSKYASCSKGGCHANVDADASFATAVDGIIGTTGSVAPGGVFEVDYLFNNVAGNGVIGVEIALPAGWTIQVGTSNSPGIGGWNSVWDVTGGETWDGTMFDISAEFPNSPDGYTVSFDGTAWDAGNRNSAFDDASAGDLDGTANQMGMDARITVPGGETPGTYYVQVLGVGHDGNKAHAVQQLTITVTGGGGTAPTLSTPTAASIGSTTATLGATVDTDGGDPPLTARGTVWDTSTAPTANQLAEGGTAVSAFSHARSALPAQTQIFYRGYATNSTGTDYSSEGSFYTEPATQASGVNFTAVNANDMTVNWTRGSGSEVIVVMKQGAPVDTDPADGTYTGYTANAAFGSGTQLGTGNYVVYKGTGTSVVVTGLASSTSYDVAVYEVAGTVDTAGDAQGSNYKLTPAAGSQTTGGGASAPTLTTPTATSLSNTTATLGANITSDGGAAITARGTVWNTTGAPITENALAEGGTATGVFSHGRSALPAGTQVFYRGYATNSAGTGYSSDGSFYTEPTTQASGVNFTAVNTNDMTVNWTRGSGTQVIVVMKQGAPVDTDPADGTYTGYTANAAFGSGSQLGTGNYVVYKGTGTSVIVTGLASSTSYDVAVYEVAGTVDTAGDAQGSNYKLTPATGSQTTGAGATNNTTAGTASAAPGNTVIDVTAPYTDDDNANNTVTFEVDIEGNWSGPDYQTATPAHSASPTTHQFTGLTNGQSYEVRVTYNDGDGVSGTSPQTISNVTPVAFDPMIHSYLSTGSAKHAGDGGWGTSGTRYGEFTCATCHTKSTTNIKRVKTAITTPDTGIATLPGDGQSIVFLDATDTTSDFGDDSSTHATSDKICEICHTYDAGSSTGVKQHAYNMGVTATHYNNKDCTACHKHNQGFKASGDCDGCHGYPPDSADGFGYQAVEGKGAHLKHTTPLAALAAVTLDPTVDQFGDATVTAVCGVCHDMTGGAHETGGGNRNINFDASTTYQFGASAPAYNGVQGTPSSTTAKSCSNVSCHFKDTPVWE